MAEQGKYILFSVVGYLGPCSDPAAVLTDSRQRVLD